MFTWFSSMPHWTKGKTDKQRGDGVFEKSIKALIDLNNVGYGKSDTNLKLDLVYNPSGAFLPSNQKDLEKEFKKVLFEKFAISFNNLFAITNLPVSRFLEYLIKSDNYEDYMHTLLNLLIQMQQIKLCVKTPFLLVGMVIYTIVILIKC